MPSEEQLVPFFTTLVCRGPGSNHDLPFPGADTLPTELSGPVFRDLKSLAFLFLDLELVLISTGSIIKLEI